ncbi:hypothetical protein L6452_28658 [Arctium lappa]|uniref:Uncharacterized protein n=1 Tax=Arctium lappa TaxID=4217 RepID=A0ACB8ZZ21_ARCLA|nr:hypothetical protein L6452_28658 [Arctium lappa]
MATCTRHPDEFTPHPATLVQNSRPPATEPATGPALLTARAISHSASGRRCYLRRLVRITSPNFSAPPLSRHNFFSTSSTTIITYNSRTVLPVGL